MNTHHVNTASTQQTRLRLFLTMAAYAYEFRSETIMSDADFDAGCQLVDTTVCTNRPHLDAWWRAHFDPDTGMWITKHPELQRIAQMYDENWHGTQCVLVGERFTKLTDADGVTP